MTGKGGENLYLKVPIGTQVFEEDNKTLIFDFRRNNDEFVVESGGKGGFGNTKFKSSTNRAPKKFTKGIITYGELRRFSQKNQNFYNTSVKEIMTKNPIGIDKNADIAVLKISTDDHLVPINFADSDNLKVGDKVLAIGNPYGIGTSVSSGIISATGRDYGNPYLQLIQTDAAINPGNSGGALINENGNLIGINSKIFSKTGAYQGIGFAIPSNLVVQISTQLIRYGEVRSLWIGNFRVAKVMYRQDNKIVEGLKIVEMENVGPLYENGIRTNDIIIKINDKTSNWNNLISSLRFATLGEELELNILTSSNKILNLKFETKN